MIASRATRVCIAGGGPAGIMLAYLLARAGVDAVVVEKHADFFRDFRGDTIHPTTLDVMAQLGLLDGLLSLPHQTVTELGAQIGDEFVRIADFSHLSTRCRFIALMPQWDFLDFLAREGRRFPTFHVVMNAEVTDIALSGDRVTGVKIRSGGLEERIDAELVIGADGRHSVVREKAGLVVQDYGAPMDVLWFRLSRKQGDPAQAFGRLDRGKMMIMLDRGDYWQCGYLIRKGDFDAIRRNGLTAFRDGIGSLVPYVRDRLTEIGGWGDVKLLTVAVDRLRTWYRAGLLCIGDAAHAMSPIGGVGINLAIQDAVASANILTGPLLGYRLSVEHLRTVQQRRDTPTRLTQGLQILIQDRLIRRILGNDAKFRPPWPLRMLDRVAVLRRIPAQAIAVGFRPERVASPNAYNVTEGAGFSRP